ncbi:MAG TPA: AzlC family ABC transporter permease [Acidimicrobiales bacterium]
MAAPALVRRPAGDPHRHVPAPTAGGEVPPAAPAGRAEAAAGARAMAPWLVGMALYALVVGVSGAASGIPGAAAWLTAPTIYSGGAQVALFDLAGSGAAPAVVLASVLAINVRLVAYSGAMARYWADRPRWWRALAAYLLVDPSFAVGLDRYARPGRRAGAHAHYLGAAALLWLVWISATALGALVGPRLPAGLHAEFVIPLFLAGEVARRASTRAAATGSAAAAVVAVGGLLVPLRLGLLVSIVAGLAVALAVAREDR